MITATTVFTLDAPVVAPPGFELAPRAHELIRGLGSRFTVLQLLADETEATLGPFGLTAPLRREFRWDEQPVITVTPGEPADFIVARAVPVVVIGVDVHRYPFACRAVDAARRLNDRVLVVDMGEGPVSGYADVVTHGCSEQASESLLRLLTSGVR